MNHKQREIEKRLAELNIGVADLANIKRLGLILYVAQMQHEVCKQSVLNAAEAYNIKKGCSLKKAKELRQKASKHENEVQNMLRKTAGSIDNIESDIDIAIDDIYKVFNKHFPLSGKPKFDTFQKFLSKVRAATPVNIQSVSPNSKSERVEPFRSKNAYDVVTHRIAKELYNEFKY